jgi:hypothetical protein
VPGLCGSWGRGSLEVGYNCLYEESGPVILESERSSSKALRDHGLHWELSKVKAKQ